MGKALAASAGFVTNPSTTLTTWTPATGDSNTVRAFDANSNAYILAMWGFGATAGVQQVTSPRLHDTTYGIRNSLKASDPRPQWQMGKVQRIYPQDVLVPQQTGGASETDAGCMLQYFENFSGADAKLVMPNQLPSQIEQLVTVQTTHTIGSTRGDWTGSVALNSFSALLKANRWYAILGYTTDTLVNAVGIHGPDTGNLRLAGPGSTDAIQTRSWYEDLSYATGLPCVCLFNASNVGSTFVDLQSVANSGTVIIDHNLALLAI